MPVADYVIETGGIGNNNATWRKWNSGLSEYWGREVLDGNSWLPSLWYTSWIDDKERYFTKYIDIAHTSGLTYPTGLFCDSRLTNTIVSYASSANLPGFAWSEQLNDASNNPTTRLKIRITHPNFWCYEKGRIHYYCKGYWKYPDIPKKRVGGKIFYIDGTNNGAVYKFYDSDGNELSDVQVGDEPYEYRVYGVPSCDKYYVFNNQLFASKRWTYHDGSYYVCDPLGTGTAIGTGKTNTAIVMAADNGAYVTADSKGYPTIWYQIKLLNDANTGGNSDWFSPSKLEVEALRTATDSNNSALVPWFQRNWIWSSSEYDLNYAWHWDNTSQTWEYNYGQKRGTGSCFAIRSF